MSLGILTITVVCLTLTGAQQQDPGRVDQIGNALKPSASGVDVPGATFIIDEINREGILFAYSAYIRTQTKLRFQIWRPSINRTNDKQFTLMAETPVLPSVDNQREDFYIESGIITKCSVVTAGDRVGVYFDESPGAIAYTFEPNNPSSLQYKVQNLSVPTQIGQIVQFDPITFPYDFSIMSYLDTYDDNITVDSTGFTTCPKGLLIPSYIKSTTTPMPTTTITGAPGATGATGPQGGPGATGSTGPRGPQGYNGTDGMIGEIGATGIQGSTGPQGQIGYNGSQGVIGDIGPLGPPGSLGGTGATGPAGPPGPKGDKPSAAPQVDLGLWGDPDMVFYLYIWLAIVSFILIIVFIMVICLCCKLRDLRRELTEYNKHKKDDDYLKNVYDNPELTGTNRKKKSNLYAENINNRSDKENNIDKQFTQISSAEEPKQEWMNSLKPDQTFDYEVGTIERESSSGAKRNRIRSSNGANDPVNSNSAPNLFTHGGLSTDYYSNGRRPRDDMLSY